MKKLKRAITAQEGHDALVEVYVEGGCTREQAKQSGDYWPARCTYDYED